MATIRNLRQVVAASAILAGLGLSGAARGESVKMTGKFAAPHREAAILEVLGIGRFSGRDGRQLEMAVERALSNADVDGRPHFDVIAGDGGGERPDGILGGTVASGVEHSRYKRKDKKCVERKDGKCVREEEREVECTRRVINVNADLRLVREADGRVVYSASKPKRDETSWCEGQNPYRTTEEAIRSMILAIAGDVRRDIAPVIEDYSIRFRESTRDLPKALNRPFKDIVKQTQRDLPGACQAWEAMDGQAPNHPSITFDLALCAEAAGDYPLALSRYREAAPLIGGGGNEATTGIERVERLIAAQEDDAARRRP